LKQLKRQAEKLKSHSDRFPHGDIHISVQKPGLYRLKRVLDEMNLEVNIRGSDSLVVSCPKALLKTTSTHKCKGELSDLTLEVQGTPPLKIKYSRRVNDLIGTFSLQNIQHDNNRSLSSPEHETELLASPTVYQLLRSQTQKVEIPLNESLDNGGEWTYAIEEVHDAFGNYVNYSTLSSDSDYASLKSPPQWHHFIVHERPRLSFRGCDAQNSLEVAKGASIDLPFQFHHSGRAYSSDGPFEITFSLSETEKADGSSTTPKIRQLELKSTDQPILINEPGWYMLNSVSSKFCSGEILEPSSCLLHNPPEPSLLLHTENIFDKCANNSVGLLVDLDLVGSPPFHVRYTIERGHDVQTLSHRIDGLRGQLEFVPREAGSYKYRFLDIADSVYEPRSLKNKISPLVQDVKPPASARLTERGRYKKACFGESVELGVSFVGESPWILQYEIVHNGKKSQRVHESVDDSGVISTGPLTQGGEYVLSLTSVSDRSNCKRPLKDSFVVDVRPKNPHATFARTDKGFLLLALENSKVDLPLRLSGEAPWTVTYRNLDENSTYSSKSTIWNQNGALEVTQKGRYQLLSMTDASCAGAVDDTPFEVTWIPRPKVSSVDGSSLDRLSTFVKKEVCQGDGDVLELELSGSPPFHVKYEEQRKGDHGSSSVKVQNIKNAHNRVAIEMDTSKAGDYVYRFSGLADSLYDHESKNAYLTITQKVNPLPSARFESPGHIYGFCKEENDGDELIPIVLEGVPPFALEVTIKHHSNLKPEILKVPHISSNRHNLLIPRRHLELGQHVVSISKVIDARRCQKSSGLNEPSVRVAVSDVPTVTPLESQIDYCVGERISFSLSGHPPFEIYYTFDGAKRKATSTSTTFRRIAEKPGKFTITDVSDSASGRCKAHKNITKVIHEMPSVKISKGKVSVVDIHEGGEAELNFEFWGTPPFEFTYESSPILCLIYKKLILVHLDTHEARTERRERCLKS
jgi:nucleoporin POM152